MEWLLCQNLVLISCSEETSQKNEIAVKFLGAEYMMIFSKSFWKETKQTYKKMKIFSKWNVKKKMYKTPQYIFVV